MAKRIVTQTMKNEEGDILMLLNSSESWSPRALELVIADIENDVHSYVVASTNIPETIIQVVNGPYGKYLRTYQDESVENNLDYLDSIPTLPPEYLGNYPHRKRSDWSDGLQGVTHSLDHWFFTQKTKIIKLHFSIDIDTNISNVSQITHMPKELRDLGCNHFGDPDYFIFEHVGYLFVPVEGNQECRSEPRLAVFRDDIELTYIGSSLLSKQNSGNGTSRAGWCAFSPINNFLHSSYNEISAEYPIFRYKVNFQELLQNQQLVLIEQENLILKKNGYPVFVPSYIQGGCFSPNGFLFICNGKAKGLDRNQGGIRVFDQYGEFLYQSSITELPFKYEYHPGFPRFEEPEGLTFWNLDSQNGGLSAPNIEGQLHAILLYNITLQKDKIWFKHYRINSLM